MAMVVKNNMSAISTLNTLNKNSAGLSKSLAKVSSGQRVNGAADDASGYAISERMRVQVRALDQDNRNTQSGTSMMKVAEGAVSSTVDILKTLKEKVVSAANDDKTDSDRAAIQKELDQSIDQINDNANVTFNGKYLVDGSHNNKVKSGGVANTMTNESLDKTTDYNTAFSKMADRNGNSLNIQDSDTVTISFVKEGRTYEASVKGSDNFTKLLDKANSTQGHINTALGQQKLDEGDSMSMGTTLRLGSTTDVAKGITVGLAGSQNQIDDVVNALLQNIEVDGATMTTDGKATLTFKIAGQTIAETAQFDVRDNGTDLKSGTKLDVSNFSIDASSGKLKFDWSAEDTEGNAAEATSAESKEVIKNIKEAIETGKVKGLDKVIADSDFAAVNARTSYSDGNSAVYGAGNAMFKVHEDTTLIEQTGDKIAIGTSSYIGKDRSDLKVNTADAGNAITFTSADAGTKGQIAGVTIKVEDQYGVINKSANAVLDNFSTSIQAEDQSSDNAIVLQVGTKANQAIKVGLMDMRAEALGLRASNGDNIQIGTQKQANAAINVLDNAISKALDQQTTIGSVESRLEYTSQNLTTASENVQASESTIRDADMAKEMTEYTKNNVLLQAAQSMLAQANQNSSAVLSLLQ